MAQELSKNELQSLLFTILHLNLDDNYNFKSNSQLLRKISGNCFFIPALYNDMLVTLATEMIIPLEP